MQCINNCHRFICVFYFSILEIYGTGLTLKWIFNLIREILCCKFLVVPTIMALIFVFNLIMYTHND